jgi:hypothetical protein
MFQVGLHFFVGVSLILMTELKNKVKITLKYLFGILYCLAISTK